MKQSDKLEAQKQSLILALAQLRLEWDAGLWEDAAFFPAIETLTNAICAVIKEQEKP